MIKWLDNLFIRKPIDYKGIMRRVYSENSEQVKTIKRLLAHLNGK